MSGLNRNKQREHLSRDIAGAMIVTPSIVLISSFFTFVLAAAT